MADQSIQFKTTQNPELRSISLNDFDFSCKPERYFIDINASDLAMATYNADLNFELINSVCNEVEFLQQLPHEYRIATSRFPDGYECDCQ